MTSLRSKGLNLFTVFVDLCSFFLFLTYCLGGYSLSGSGGLAYYNDLLRALLVLFLAVLALGVHPQRFFVIRGFLNLESAILKKDRLNRAGAFILCGLILLGATFMALPLVRHQAFESWFWDLGVMEQVIWRKAFGYGLTATAINGQYNPPLDFLIHQHTNFWLIPIAGIYRVFPYTETLLILQSLALLLAVIPIWKIAKILFPQHVPVILLPIFYWCWHSVHKNNIWDIHEACYLTMVSSWAFYFFLKEKFGLTFLLTVAVGLFKEDAWVLAGAMGFYFLSSKGRWTWAILCLLCGFSFFAAYGILQNKVNTLSERYSYLGNHFSDILPTLKAHPFIFIQHLFTPGPLQFLVSAILLSGGLWLLAGWAIIPVLPTLFESALSSLPGMYSFNSHYVLGIGGPIFFATAVGVQRLYARVGDKRGNAFLTLATLIALAQLRFSEPAEIKFILSGDDWANRHCLSRLVAQIPKTDAVYTENPLASHLSQRALYFSFESQKEFLPLSWATVSVKEELPRGFKETYRDCGFKIGQQELTK